MPTTPLRASQPEHRPAALPERTVLRLSRPFGATLLLAGLLVALFAGLCELAARSEALRARLPPESIGSGQPQLDLKLVLLREMVAAGGPVDALFVGSSQVFRAIDPQLFEQAYRRRAGRPVRSFNFGLGGMSETGEEPLTRILVEEFQPRLVVIGASSYGLDERRDLKFQQFLDKSAWFHYHRGRLDLDGWLLEHSAAFRRYHGHLFWADPPPETLDLVKRSIADMRPDGHSPFEVGPFQPLDPETLKTLPDFSASPLHLEALSALLDLRRPGLEMVVAEMPVHETVIASYGRGPADHAAALDAIEAVAARHGVRFLRYPYGERPIPADGWADFIHLNRVGTAIYSEWLGERIAELSALP